MTASHSLRASALGLMVAGALTGGFIGCGEPSRSSEQTKTDTVDQLRALPYLGFSSAKVVDKSGVVHHERGRASAGFSLYTSRNLCRADLIDLEGKSLQTWEDPSPDCHYWSHAELLPGGDLIVTGSTTKRAAQTGGYLMRLDWHGKLIWLRPILAHHDVEMTPGRRIATLTAVWRRFPDYGEADVLDNDLTLLNLEGDVIEAASFYRLFKSNPAEFALQGVRRGRTEEEVEKTADIDLFHANSLEFMSHRHLEGRHPIYAADNVLITVRHQDTVAIVDWPRKKLIWAWGQGELSGPHAGTVLESGNILIFDNGLSRGWSRVVELEPVAKKIVWEYKAPNPKNLFTIGRGAAQRLPNGNTLISNSDLGQVIEVTQAGEVVWEFFNPLGNDSGDRATIVRMMRYRAEFIEGLRAKHHGRRERTLSARSEQR